LVEDPEIVFHNFVVELLLANVCSLRAVPIIYVDQHLLNEPAALLVTAALSS